jgi:hypothetical protein
VAVSASDAALSPARPPAPSPADKRLVGRWRIEFDNGVTAVCEVGEDRTASFVERALPKYFGKAMFKDGANVIEYDGGRTERWTPVGERMIVEHWWPGADYPAARPVLGIADRVMQRFP